MVGLHHLAATAEGAALRLMEVEEGAVVRQMRVALVEGVERSVRRLVTEVEAEDRRCSGVAAVEEVYWMVSVRWALWGEAVAVGAHKRRGLAAEVGRGRGLVGVVGLGVRVGLQMVGARQSGMGLRHLL